MNQTAHYKIVAAAAATVALIAIGCGSGKPGATPTPQANPVNEGALPAGTYYADSSRVNNVAGLTFTLPAGWSGGPVLPAQGSFNEHPAIVYKDVANAGLWLESWLVDAVYADVCHWRGTDTPIGPTATDLATALAAQTGRQASKTSDVTFAGFPAKRIETVTPDQDSAFCDGGLFFDWPGVGPNTELTGRGAYVSKLTDVVYAADVGGKRVVIVAAHLPETTAQDLAELDAIVASMQIQP